MTLLTSWLCEDRPEGSPENVCVLREREGTRPSVLDQLASAVRSHFVEATALDALGFPVTAEEVRQSIPTRKAVRSGDLGEILGTEYVREFTDFRVPINRLRYKDDRDTTMRGDDILGVRSHSGRVQVLKGEAKSRARLSDSTVRSACAALQRHRARPNPSSLAFVLKRLREEGRHEDAELFQHLLSNTIAEKDVEHFVFTLSGNDPGDLLRAHASGSVRRRLTGVVIFDHQNFIRSIFDLINASAA